MAPCKGSRNSGKFCLWNRESYRFESGTFTEGNWNSEGRGDPKDAISVGVGGGFLRSWEKSVLFKKKCFTLFSQSCLMSPSMPLFRAQGSRTSASGTTIATMKDWKENSNCLFIYLLFSKPSDMSLALRSLHSEIIFLKKMRDLSCTYSLTVWPASSPFS